MDIEQTIKDLQVQNAQFQQMFLALDKGQEDLNTFVYQREEEESEETSRCFESGKKVQRSSQMNSRFRNLVE